MFRLPVCFILLGILSASRLNAQSFTNSPYSRFGLGDLSGCSYQPGIGMGGAAVSLRSNHFINQVNPASHTAFDSLSFIFDIALTTRIETFSTNEHKINRGNTDVSFFSLGFPVTKWWGAGIGLLPYSNVGYNISDNYYIDTVYLENTYKGSGGINQFVVSNGFRIFSVTDTSFKINSEKNKITILTNNSLSLGVNSVYYFGSLERKSASVFPDEGYMFDLYTTNKTILNDLGFRGGLQYVFNRRRIVSGNITGNYSIIAGLTFDTENNINAKNTSLVTKYLNIGGVVTVDTIENSVNKEGTVTFPVNLGAGLTFINNDVFTLSLDYRWQQWSAAKFFGASDSLADSHSFALGTQIIPEPHRYNKYFRMVNYRAGVHFTQSYLNIRGQKINDIGISFGLGLPIRKPDKTDVSGLRKKLPPMINIAFDIGQRGTLRENLIKERYYQISLNLSLYDIWFVKRRFN